MSKVLASIRSNLRYTVNYDTTELEPQAEIVILSFKPVYSIDKKRHIVKDAGLEESRFELSLEAINKVIGELQAVAHQLQTYAQAGEAFNAIIRSLPKKQ